MPDRAATREVSVSNPSTSPERDMRRSYVRVVVVWLLVLGGLYLLQSMFS